MPSVVKCCLIHADHHVCPRWHVQVRAEVQQQSGLAGQLWVEWRARQPIRQQSVPPQQHQQWQASHRSGSVGEKKEGWVGEGYMDMLEPGSQNLEGIIIFISSESVKMFWPLHRLPLTVESHHLWISGCEWYYCWYNEHLFLLVLLRLYPWNWVQPDG